MAVAKLHAARRVGLTEVERAGIVFVIAGAVLIPLVVKMTLLDTFRLPKELAFRAEAIVLLAIGGLWAVSRRRTWRIDWRRTDYAVAAAVVLWTAVTVLASTNRALSIDSFATIIAAVVIYLATTIVARTTGVVIIDLIMAGCCLNAIVAMLQEARIWNPFQFSEEQAGHLQTTALIGNPNDVGTFMLVPLLAALVMTVAARGRRRWIYAGVTLLLMGGLLASATRTAIAAFIAGAVVFAVSRSWRTIFAVAVALAVVALMALSPSTTLGRSARLLWQGFAENRYDIILSERLPLFLSAVDMLRDHPLTGVGPGCYAYHDIAYRTRLPSHYPAEWVAGWRQKAGQAHNDHLQVAAETGLPGYALLLLALDLAGMAGWKARHAPQPGLEQRFAALFLPAFAVAVFVVMLAQFPLELAAPRLMLVTFSALAITWIRPDGQE